MKQETSNKLKQAWWFICRHYFVFFWVPVYAYMAMVFQISSIPDPLALPGMHLAVQLFSGWTNSILHFLEYFVLSMILSVALRHSQSEFLKKHSYVLAFIIAAIFGISDEVHQLYVPGRTFAYGDIAFDVLGGFAAQIARKIIKLEKNYLDKIF